MKLATFVLASLALFCVNGSMEISLYEQIERGCLFRNACYNGELEKIRTMKQLGHLNSQEMLEEGLSNTCWVKGSLETVKYFIEEEHIDPVHSPFRMAAERGYLDVVEYLLNYPVVLDKRRGMDALGSAAHKGHIKVVKVILDALISEGKLNMTSIHSLFDSCADRGQHEIMKLLLKSLQFDSSNISLHMTRCCENGHFETLKLLLSASRRTLRNERASEIVAIAHTKGHFDIHRLLLLSPMKIESHDIMGEPGFPEEFLNRFDVIQDIRSNLNSSNSKARGIPRFLESFQVTSDGDLSLLDWVFLATCMMKNREELSLMLCSLKKLVPYTPANNLCDLVVTYKKCALWIAHLGRIGDLPIELVMYIASLMFMPMVEKYMI